MTKDRSTYGEDMTGPVRETRIAVTVEDYDAAVRLYRDALGLPALEEWDGPDGRGMVLDAGRATLELLSPEQAALVDRIEAGARVSGPIRLALHVGDSAGTAARLVAGGARRVADPVITPWGHRNTRVQTPDGLQLTLFELPGNGG
jgi:catechol 2,3-dioxygenase-like lactoylglutathione lyase family enzyme